MISEQLFIFFLGGLAGVTLKNTVDVATLKLRVKQIEKGGENNYA